MNVGGSRLSRVGVGVIAAVVGAPAVAAAEAPAALPAPPAVAAVAQQLDSGNLTFVQVLTPRHKGYRSSLIAYKERPSARTHLMFAFGRWAMNETQSQTSEFSWSLRPGAVQLGRRLKGSSLRTGKGMGSNGSISMGLAKGSQYARATGEGCTGFVEYRVGRFTGRLRVHLRDRYFKRIALERAKVVVYREHDHRCGAALPPPPSCPDDLWLSASDPEAGVAVGVFRTDEGRVDQRVAVAGKSGDADALHRISVQVALPEAFIASDDLTAATVDGDVAGPWLSGHLSYLAPPPASEETDEDCGPYRSTSGIATGDYTAHFDAIGPVTPASTGMAATLRRQNP